MTVVTFPRSVLAHSSVFVWTGEDAAERLFGREAFNMFSVQNIISIMCVIFVLSVLRLTIIHIYLGKSVLKKCFSTEHRKNKIPTYYSEPGCSKAD